MSPVSDLSVTCVACGAEIRRLAQPYLRVVFYAYKSDGGHNTRRADLCAACQPLYYRMTKEFLASRKPASPPPPPPPEKSEEQQAVEAVFGETERVRP